jgi:hypothetical protein
MWSKFIRPDRANRFQKTLNREADERFVQIMREHGKPPSNYPFFNDPPVYVVLLGTGPDGSCEFAIENTPECDAILCFLSPVDAAIEGMLRAKPGLGYEVRSALHIPERYFLTTDGGDLLLMLHLAWIALDGRMLLRPSGMPGRLWRPLLKDARAGMPVRFEVDACSLDEADYLYECAGLYAWEDTHKRLSGQADQADQAAKFALRIGQPMHKPPGLDGSECELALFDPDGRQWHFLPQEVSQEC